jgi:hypothetical protein
VEFLGVVGKTTVRVYCKQSHRVDGFLGTAYSSLAFKNGCFTQLSGTTSAICQPKKFGIS